MGVRIPITNVYGGGDYTAQIAIGGAGKLANVILDTGSSTLAVSPSVYDPNADPKAVRTPLAQDVLYGSGGWTGPVVHTKIAIGEGAEAVSVDAYIALSDEQEAQGFSPADGILGLAYNTLNEAHNLEAYLEGQGVNPPHTLPWPFPIENSSVALRQFAVFLSRMPKEDLTPYFTALEEAKVDKNIFAFYTLRSVPSAGTEKPAEDPLNKGFFILGGGEEQTDLYNGSFASVDVVDDAYYNTDLLYVEVEGGHKIKVSELPRQFAKTMHSNSIIDSGTNSLRISAPVFKALVSSLGKVNVAFGAQIR
ncbi:MAG TPA: pepsin-like aspartic protease, partial [Solirubrobacteraceae bacterium]|nr:pepsin-like aspartic protease [Solirubrobacteraceae bacterium]